ncbi:L-seryl-tRNA(Sec) selenium transferase [Sediminibacillus halophilus]|uniref:L-seryl-tRNA(Sec) selenium transferase n=1 Tax=Sediminibacillus halophilus TaxID=482461 RepID=A0A1G9N705_9BACI|nr:L-seryl-tRNA(Sec) selenium transferase [Sediminibacillus halophilus]SDL81907.1 L-seryl-tRNA(Ser) seleniumtransferase [Sediminibacillus halophilus]
MKHLLRELPPVHEFQQHPKFQYLTVQSGFPEEEVTSNIKAELAELRKALLDGTNPLEEAAGQSFTEYIWQNTEKRLERFHQDRLRPVINATGTVLHTNLGRARLSSEAIDHVKQVAVNYSNLEYDIDEGKRGSRHDILEDLLVKLTGAEAAMVVNNNAAAVFLVLRALAKEKNVIVSRGQLVEIGGSFRVSSIMEESGANLVEVGTTNKTHLYDYQNAVDEETGMILKVHTSNFKTVGFTDSVSTKDLAEWKSHYPDIIFYEDLGSGALYDFRAEGIGDEPIIKEVIKEGADLVSFSGDKLLGGPQAGIIAGKRELIQRLKKHQLARVLRVDKMTFAGLEKTLRAYISGTAVQQLPTVRDIVKRPETIKKQAEMMIGRLEAKLPYLAFEMMEDASQIGGGTMPAVELPTYVIAITSTKVSAQQLADTLRLGSPAIIARIRGEKVLLDFRTVAQEEMEGLYEQLLHLLKEKK